MQVHQVASGLVLLVALVTNLVAGADHEGLTEVSTFHVAVLAASQEALPTNYDWRLLY